MCVNKSDVNKIDLSVNELKPGCDYYRPQRSCEGYVFTGVCLSTGEVGVFASVHAGIPHTTTHPHPPEQTHPPKEDTPSEQTPPHSRHPPGSRHTPPKQTPPTLQQTPPSLNTVTAADVTHPTGMHSCFEKCFHLQNESRCIT